MSAVITEFLEEIKFKIIHMAYYAFDSPNYAYYAFELPIKNPTWSQYLTYCPKCQKNRAGLDHVLYNCPQIHTFRLFKLTNPKKGFLPW